MVIPDVVTVIGYSENVGYCIRTTVINVDVALPDSNYTVTRQIDRVIKASIRSICRRIRIKAEHHIR